jgi:peptide chain release factor 2
VDAWERLEQELSDIEILTELSAQEGDESSLKELEVSLAKLEEEIDKLEMRKMLGGEDDKRNAILTIHPGAGGTESADWAEMLLRMYLRYFERCGFDKETLDILQDDIAGIKSVTIEVKGEYAFGLLKSENGIHRLVRISPFDANSKRHTSFASVFVMPVIDTEVNIDINPADLRIDTYRASGAGGQHINKTDSAVRITHIPTNMVVTCQSERSQHRNKANAMKILYSRLYQMKKAEAESSLNTLHKSKKDIAWGSQIRSYVFHPYNMVKDHRTGVETGNIQAVMDGDLDKFVRGYLLKAKS